jgi:serine phosphatase RsbU (regulator of sigma subunit)
MKNNYLFNFKCLLIFILSFSTGIISAQEEKTQGEKQALFIYNFSKYIDWPNIDELNSFDIGVIGDTNNIVYDQLVKMAKIKTVRDKPINIKRITDYNNLAKVQLVYFDRSGVSDINTIYNIVGTKPILLVAKGFPFGKSMINFVVDDGNIKFELNENKCNKANLKVSKVITILAIKTEKEWDSLLDKIEDISNSDKATVEIDTKDLVELVKEQKKLLLEIKANTKKLNAQKDKLKKQTKELAAKEDLIKATKAEINVQKALIDEQLAKIEDQKQNLITLNKDVAQKQQEVLIQQQNLKREAASLIAIKEEYKKVEQNLKEKEILVAKQDKKIASQGDEIVTKTSTIKSQQSIIWLSIIFLIIVSALGLWAYRSYQLKNEANKLILKQKDKIEGQHKILEEQHREITDSINYAKRIQDAILPPLKLVKGFMPDSFILYKPKDIVAGDFYWMEGINNLIIFAAADCTGHGVPGAMVSVVCNNAMNRAVREFLLIEPHEILNKTREIVMETFENSDEDVRDGMDIALCSLNTETNKLIFAGANNGLYLVRNGELIEFKPDKQPIGNYEHYKPFTKHEIQLEKGDVIYMYTDGYADQFGGEKGKKFKYKPFKNLLISIHQKPMDEQQQIINDTFIKWRGDLEQIDDVCIIGVKI